MFNLSKAELESYIAGLRINLCRVAGGLAPRSLAHRGYSTEDAMQDVLAEVSAFLQHGKPLKPFVDYSFPILTLKDVSRYARRRLRANFDTSRQSGVRGEIWTTHRRDEIFTAIFGEPPPEEHEYYDRRFFDDLTRAVEKDDLAYRLVTLILNCHVVPGTKDLNICDNTALAEEFDCEPSDIRLARNRIHTVKNRLIAARKAQDEGLTE